jgi:YHS domain-containing protein
MRVVQLVVVLALVAVVVTMLVKARVSIVRRPAAGPRDELVKDPVCGVYVVRSRAVRRDGSEGPLYFCSAACARRYTAGTRA